MRKFVVYTVDKKRKRERKAKAENYDDCIQIRMKLQLCANVNVNSLILNVATTDFSMSFNYFKTSIDFNFNTCRIYVLF